MYIALINTLSAGAHQIQATMHIIPQKFSQYLPGFHEAKTNIPWHELLKLVTCKIACREPKALCQLQEWPWLACRPARALGACSQ